VDFFGKFNKVTYRRVSGTLHYVVIVCFLVLALRSTVQRVGSVTSVRITIALLQDSASQTEISNHLL
jgi:hypothetical protein